MLSGSRAALRRRENRMEEYPASFPKRGFGDAGAMFSGQGPAHGQRRIKDLFNGLFHPKEFFLVSAVRENGGMQIPVSGMAEGADIDAVFSPISEEPAPCPGFGFWEPWHPPAPGWVELSQGGKGRTPGCQILSRWTIISGLFNCPGPI